MRKRFEDCPSRPILAATDLSATGGRAAAWGAALAGGSGSGLCLLHALDLLGWSLQHVDLNVKAVGSIRQAAEHRLATLADRFARQDIACTWMVEEGPAAETILDAAQTLECSTLLIGTQGHSTLTQLLLGSTAKRVMTWAPCPVLAVHEEDRLPRHPIQRILFATDAPPLEIDSVRNALNLLRPLGPQPEVVLVHAYHLPYEIAMGTTYGMTPDGLELRDTVAEEVLAALEEEAITLRFEGHEIQTMAVKGEPAQVILEQAAGLGANIIVLERRLPSHHHRVFLGGTIERVVSHAPCPVLVVDAIPDT